MKVFLASCVLGLSAFVTGILGGALATRQDLLEVGPLVVKGEELKLESRYGEVIFPATDVLWFTTNVNVTTFLAAAQQAKADHAPPAVTRQLATRALTATAREAGAARELLDQLDRELAAQNLAIARQGWTVTEPLNLDRPPLPARVILQRSPTAALSIAAESVNFLGFIDYGTVVTGPNGLRIPYRIQQPVFSTVGINSSVLVQTRTH
jgi:hypothetical protein